MTNVLVITGMTQEIQVRVLLITALYFERMENVQVVESNYTSLVMPSLMGKLTNCVPKGQRYSLASCGVRGVSSNEHSRSTV